MTYSPVTVFNRQISNSLALVVKRSFQGEVHGSYLSIGQEILEEMSGGWCSDNLTKMARHLQAVGFERLVEGTPVVYFNSKKYGHNLVLKELVHDVE